MNANDWKKIAKGAALAIGGAVAAYVASVVVPAMQGSSGLALTLAPLVSILANVALKYLSSKQ